MTEMLEVSMALFLHPPLGILALLCPSNNFNLPRRQVASVRKRPTRIVNLAREVIHFFIATSLLNVVRSKDTDDTIFVRIYLFLFFFFSFEKNYDDDDRHVELVVYL